LDIIEFTSSVRQKVFILIDLLRRLSSHINNRRKSQLGLLFLLMILASFAEVISIGAVLPFLVALTAPERVFEHHLAQPYIQALKIIDAKQLLFPLTVVFGLATLASGAIRLLLLWLQTRLSHSVGSDFSISIYRRTLYQPYAVHLSRNSSEVIAGIAGKTHGVVHSVILPILTILGSTMVLIAILIALIAIEPVVAVTAFAGFAAIYAFVIGITRKRLAKNSQIVNQESNQVIKALQEGLGGIRDVLVDGTQTTYCNIYRNADIPLRRAQANIQLISASPRFLVESLGMVLIAALAYLLAIREEGVVGAIPVLGALAMGAQRLLPVLQQCYSSWTAIRGGQDSLRDALELLDQPLPAHAYEQPSALLPFTNAITLDNIAFRYSPQTPWVLMGVNLTLSKGGRIGFIGATGSGKSTLLDIVMGLLQPVQGTIAIDGTIVNNQNQRAWQAHIAHVPQAIFLADSTIAENIALGVARDEIDFQRVRKSAQRAQIAETIEGWDKQYDTLVGERGVRLSGGQRQRIGIARALYKHANVIIFDEASSALDGETEKAVMEAIETLGEELTLLIIAHRLTTLKHCTLVVELSNGKIKRAGTYKELVEDNVKILHNGSKVLC
jgi:ABC-type bacteriocin/lantibiotic exporter with double-glycine peptidase domain